jgi:hypothetical protein
LLGLRHRLLDGSDEAEELPGVGAREPGDHDHGEQAEAPDAGPRPAGNAHPPAILHVLAPRTAPHAHGLPPLIEQPDE